MGEPAGSDLVTSRKTEPGSKSASLRSTRSVFAVPVADSPRKASSVQSEGVRNDRSYLVAPFSQTASASLASRHLTCAHLSVAVDTTGFNPGGDVAVTVSCSVDLSTLTGLHLPAHETVSDRFVEPIDLYRSTTP